MMKRETIIVVEHSFLKTLIHLYNTKSSLEVGEQNRRKVLRTDYSVSNDTTNDLPLKDQGMKEEGNNRKMIFLRERDEGIS